MKTFGMEWQTSAQWGRCNLFFGSVFKKNGKKFWRFEKLLYLCTRNRERCLEIQNFRSDEETEFLIRNAEIAQLVEHNLAKVGVAGPSPVFRSTD